MQPSHLAVGFAAIPEFHEIFFQSTDFTRVIEIGGSFVTACQRPVKIAGIITQQECFAGIMVLGRRAPELDVRTQVGVTVRSGDVHTAGFCGCRVSISGNRHRDAAGPIADGIQKRLLVKDCRLKIRVSNIKPRCACSASVCAMVRTSSRDAVRTRAGLYPVACW